MAKININLREKHIIGRRTKEHIVPPRMCPALATQHLLLVGTSAARRPFRFQRPRPRMTQILACIAGEGRVWIDNGWKRCAPGQAYLTPRDVYHAYEATGRGTWKIAWAMFEERPGSPALLPLSAPALVNADVQPFQAVITGLFDEVMRRREPLIIQHWVDLIALQARRMVQQEPMDDRLDSLWQQVETNLAHPWSLARLAAASQVSTEHLRRLSHARLGRSPMAHVATLRLRSAATLLATGSYSVAGAARRVGYNDPFAFSTAFKRAFGVPPSRYH